MKRTALPLVWASAGRAPRATAARGEEFGAIGEAAGEDGLDGDAVGLVEGDRLVEGGQDAGLLWARSPAARLPGWRKRPNFSTSRWRGSPVGGACADVRPGRRSRLASTGHPRKIVAIQ